MEDKGRIKEEAHKFDNNIKKAILDRHQRF